MNVFLDCTDSRVLKDTFAVQGGLGGKGVFNVGGGHSMLSPLILHSNAFPHEKKGLSSVTADRKAGI